MTWRLHISNRAIQYLDILDGEPTVVAAWSRRDRVAYYDLETGAPLGEHALRTIAVENRQGIEWQAFLAELVAPNGAPLPIVRMPHITIYTTDDGRMRLYHVNQHQLYLESEDKEVPLEVEETEEFRVLALDRFLGLSAALAEDGKLHVYQQHIRVGVFDLGLSVERDLMPSVAISRGGGSIFVCDGQHIILTDSSGKARKKLETPYFVGKMACSPAGRYLVTSDLETGVVRVYHGADLTLLRQRFAVDLMAKATQLQLMGDPPPISVALSALAIDNRGIIAFAMSGVICVTALTQMDELPRPQALL